MIFRNLVDESGLTNEWVFSVNIFMSLQFTALLENAVRNKTNTHQHLIPDVGLHVFLLKYRVEVFVNRNFIIRLRHVLFLMGSAPNLSKLRFERVVQLQQEACSVVVETFKKYKLPNCIFLLL